MRKDRRFLATELAGSISALIIGIAAASTAHAQEKRLTLSSTTHGFARDQNNNPVELNAKTILLVQQGLIDSLRARLNKADAATFDAALAKLAKAGADEGDRVYANAVAIASLLEKVQLADGDSLRTRNIKLLTRYGSLVDKPVNLQDLNDAKPPAFANLPIDRFFPYIDIGKLFPLRPIYSYATRCSLAGVPIPPPLNVSNPTGGWVNAGEQKVSYLEPPKPPPAGHPNKFSQMFYWIPASGKGLCVANPIVEDKVNKPKSINAFGVICQSIAAPNKPSHACFWDNATDDMAYDAPHDIHHASDFVAPPHLPQDNQCTDCHSGSHAFIVMPGFGIADQTLIPSAIEEAIKAYDNAHSPNFHNQDNYFIPLVDSNWPQNKNIPYPAGAATDPNDGSTCGGCHGPNGGFLGKTLPNVNAMNTPGLLPPRDNLFKFCSFILPNFLTSAHDPANYYDGAMRNQAASSPQGVTALYEACAGIFPGGYFPATQNAWLVHRDPP